MVATDGSVIYLVVVVKVNNITCRVFLDTGPGNSYASSALLEKLNIQPVKKEPKQIEMMMCAISRTINVLEVKIRNLNGSFQFKLEPSKVER